MSTNVRSPDAPHADRNGFPDPPWWLACKSALMSGSTQAIILHLNTRDYALPGKFLVPFLTGRLATRDIVAIYNRSSGIRFPMPTMEQKAKDLLGLDKPAQANDQPGLRRPRRCHRTAVGPGLRLAQSTRGRPGPARKAHARRRPRDRDPGVRRDPAAGRRPAHDDRPTTATCSSRCSAGAPTRRSTPPATSPFSWCRTSPTCTPPCAPAAAATTPSKCRCPTVRPARLHRMVSGNAAYRVRTRNG